MRAIYFPMPKASRRSRHLHKPFLAQISQAGVNAAFTAVFFVQCMKAIGCQTIHLENS
jgi:hypothetical protein